MPHLKDFASVFSLGHIVQFSARTCFFVLFCFVSKQICFWNMLVWKEGVSFPLMRGLQPFVTFYWHVHLARAVGCWLSAWGDLRVGQQLRPFLKDTMPSLCAWPVGTCPLRWWSVTSHRLPDWSSNPFSWPPAFHPAALKERGKSSSRLIVGK